MATTGVYPGSFDPITNGHLDIISGSLSVVDKLYVGVAADLPSAKNPLFTLEERVELVRQDVAQFNSQKDRVEVCAFNGLLVNFAKEQNANVIIRGLRAVSDFEYEFQMSCMNSKLCDDIQTIFLPASEHTQFIASRFVKEIARLQGDVTNLVSKNVEKALSQKFVDV